MNFEESSPHERGNTRVKTSEHIKEFSDIVVLNMYRSILRYRASSKNTDHHETDTLLMILESEVYSRDLI